jgi:hypothetical protein
MANVGLDFGRYKSDEMMNRMLATLPELHARVVAAAEEVAAIARTKAASHGNLAADIKIISDMGRKDRVVILDRDDGENIEFGHFYVDNRGMGGRPKGTKTHTWVPGLFIMSNTFNDVPGGGIR